jgi:hypothetical protein
VTSRASAAATRGQSFSNANRVQRRPSTAQQKNPQDNQPDR